MKDKFREWVDYVASGQEFMDFQQRLKNTYWPEGEWGYHGDWITIDMPDYTVLWSRRNVEEMPMQFMAAERKEAKS